MILLPFKFDKLASYIFNINFDYNTTVMVKTLTAFYFLKNCLFQVSQKSLKQILSYMIKYKFSLTISCI